MMGLIKPAILNRSDNNYIYNFNHAGAQIDTVFSKHN